MKTNVQYLILFTYEYPSGLVSETFLEAEIVYLAKEFKQIIIIPTTCNSKIIRNTPENVTILPIENNEPSRLKKVIIITRNLFTFSSILYYQLFIDKKWRYIKKFKSTLRSLALDLNRTKKIESLIIKNNWQNYLFYDYWFENATLSLALLKKSGIIHKCICRAHGSDIYDERWENAGVPNRSFKVKYIDNIFCVSNYGLNYFKTKIKVERSNKLKLSYLGINSRNVLPGKPGDHIFTLVSCSRLIPLKRVSKIIDILKNVELHIRWIHFGDGELYDEIKTSCEYLPENILIDFKGHVANNEIYDFYDNNFVDLFITMSESEGMPVSIMEAMSYGIPVLATDVGGIPEIVNEKTGFLIRKDEAPEKITQILQYIIEVYPFNRNEIIEFFKTNFSAGNNFKRFIKQIKSI